MRKPFELPQLTWWDRVWGSVSAKWGREILENRIREQMLRGFGESFEGTRQSRHKKYRPDQGGSGDDHLDQHTLWELREIAYELDRNDGLSVSLIDQGTANIVGPWGFSLYCRTSSPELNTRIEDGWWKWLAEECDPSGEDHGWERLRNIFRSTLIAGDEFVQVDEASPAVPPVFRIIEAPRVLTPHQASEPLQRVNGRSMTHGISHDAGGRPEWYFVCDDIPDQPYVRYSDGKLIPGHTVIPFVRKRRASNTRCRPIMTPVFRDVDDLDDIISSERLCLKLAAATGLFITTKNNPDDAARLRALGMNSAGERIEQLDPMSVHYMSEGEDAKFLQYTRPATQVQEFMRMIKRYVGLPLGIPYELFFFDFSQATLGTLRVSLQTAQRRFREMQFWYSTRLDKLFQWWLTIMVRRGRYPRRDDIFAHEWGLPGWPSPQPAQDAAAAKIGIEMGFSSRAIAARAQGEDIETINADLAREDAAILARAKQSGLKVTQQKEVPLAS